MAIPFFTRKGDEGFTELAGRKVAKCDRLVACEGDLDELVSLLGFASNFCSKKSQEIISDMQNSLFIVTAEIAGADKKITAENVDALEKTIDSLNVEVPNHFVIPDGTQGSAVLHVCRAVCRRAERSIIEANAGSVELKKFINRLSSLLFVLALFENKIKKVKEEKPEY